MTSPTTIFYCVSAAGTTAVQSWTLVIAGLGVVATLVSAFLLRRTGKGTVKAADRAAAASEQSSQAAQKSANAADRGSRAAETSAQAAQEAVGVNRETATGVARRAESDALARRYHDAVSQLGHDKAPARLAGIYALSRLADDWSEQRQSCVDVLCAYLRLPWSVTHDDPATFDRSEYEVRDVIRRIFQERLRTNAAVSWRDLTYDFTGAVLRDFSLEYAAFDVPPLFTRATFAGDCIFQVVDFGDAANFDEIHVTAGSLQMTLDIEGSTDRGSAHSVKLRHATVEPTGRLEINTELHGSNTWLYIDDMSVSGEVRIILRRSSSVSANVSMARAHLADGAVVTIHDFDTVNDKINAVVRNDSEIGVVGVKDGARILAVDWSAGAATIEIHQALIDSRRAPTMSTEVSRTARVRYVTPNPGL